MIMMMVEESNIQTILRFYTDGYLMEQSMTTHVGIAKTDRHCERETVQ